MERWKATQLCYDERDCKRAHYMSLEFLMGRALSNSMLNLDITEEVAEALRKFGLELEELREAEPDAGLGNGGLGRLAACFLDSCATLSLPVRGYGLRYEYGMFRQRIEQRRQIEEPDHWLRDGHPWEMERPEYTVRVQFGGRTVHRRGHDGTLVVDWIDTNDVLAVPYDILIPGYKNDTVNTLRLWKSEATDEFDLGEFNEGSYPEAVAAKNDAEHITMVLYPNDKSENGKELRLRQQYLLASATLQDVISHWLVNHNGFDKFAEKNCFQLNDTHPTIAVAELMRLLIDSYGMEWHKAWKITSRTMAYTNHTLLPEALEKWPVRLFEKLLPRLMEIIYEINARFLEQVSHRWPGDNERLARMSIIEEGDEKMVRMAYLAIVGSYSVNGVAQLHSDLLREGLFRDFYELWPKKFNNKTNGVTQRRWLAMCNPELRELINATIGDGWISDLDQLKKLAPYAKKAGFRKKWHAAKQHNKQRLAELVERKCGVHFNPEAMFDVQVKRIHEYKRQLLNVLHVIHLYNRIRNGDTENWTPRCVLIGGKAAPGYVRAKRIIRLVNNVAAKINNDPLVGDKLKLAFFPNYRVSAMEVICPGTDLSEQVSTAGKEASGTGNMKFMMNGALTIGTLDGANIEIREEVGDDHFFLFGLNAEEVQQRQGNYDPNAIIAGDENLAQVMSLLESGYFNPLEPGLFDDLIGSIRDPNDPWMTAADFTDYVRAQQEAADRYRDRDAWVISSILNTAGSGKFSTDRTMRQYNEEIWKLHCEKKK
jgi:starch phosphorylase